MPTPVKVVVALVVVVVLAFGGWFVFEHFERADKIKDAGKPCDVLDAPTGDRTLPPGFVVPAGQKLLKVDKVAKTSVVYASVPGGRDDLVGIRDEVARQLESAGYRRTASDQEPTFEADATVTKAGVEDTINVRPLCQGRVVIRYTLH